MPVQGWRTQGSSGVRGRGRAIHICRSEIRRAPGSIPWLEVIITYIRQLTRPPLAATFIVSPYV